MIACLAKKSCCLPSFEARFPFSLNFPLSISLSLSLFLSLSLSLSLSNSPRSFSFSHIRPKLSRKTYNGYHCVGLLALALVCKKRGTKILTRLKGVKSVLIKQTQQLRNHNSGRCLTHSLAIYHDNDSHTNIVYY